MLLAAACRILPRERWKVFVVSPRTLLRWHRELVRRKLTYRPGAGRTTTRSGYRRSHRQTSQGEPPVGLPQDPGRAAEGPRPGVRHVHPNAAPSVPLGPSPRRGGPSWSELLDPGQWNLGIDFFAVETAWLRTPHVPFGIELGSRRAHILASPGTRSRRG
jgi:putative transposase